MASTGYQFYRGLSQAEIIAVNFFPDGKAIPAEGDRRWRLMFVVKQNQDMVNKTFRFPQELMERLEQVAKEKNISVNNLVKQCCEYALGELPQGDR